jgi:hypothetical protein
MVKKLVVAALITVSAFLALAFFVYPRFRLIISDPAIRKAWLTCHSESAENRAACYGKHALEQNDPDICWLTGPSIDDACMQTVFKASKDPDICSHISKPGVKFLCEEYFQKASTVTK